MPVERFIVWSVQTTLFDGRPLERILPLNRVIKVLNGIAEYIAGTTGAMGDFVAGAAKRLLTTVPLASRVQDADASCNVQVETIRYKGCDPVVGQDFATAATRCCRAMRDVDIYLMNVRAIRSDYIPVRFGPVARGGDVEHSTSYAESRWSGSAGYRGFSGAGGATSKLICADPEGVRCMASADARISETWAAVFCAAFKSSGKHAATVAIPLDCQLSTT